MLVSKTNDVPSVMPASVFQTIVVRIIRVAAPATDETGVSCLFFIINRLGVVDILNFIIFY